MSGAGTEACCGAIRALASRRSQQPQPAPASSVHSLKELFDSNRAWAARITAQEPDFFERLALQQNPEFLWIGCSDSRVPANEIVGRLPGELFVHRNVANVVVHTDLNCLSVLQFAVDVLRVKHVMVVGHYGCGGVSAAMQNAKLGLIDNWLRHVQDVAMRHRDALAAIDDTEARSDRLCELNVIEQALNVCQTTIVQDAWARGQELTVHGLIYRLQDGLLRDLRMSASDPADAEASYHAAVADSG
jgi:carbonic anhydrase